MQDFLINYLNIFNIAYISLWIATILTIYTGLKYSYMTYIFNQKGNNMKVLYFSWIKENLGKAMRKFK